MTKIKERTDSMFLTAVYLTATAHGISVQNIDVDTRARVVNINKQGMSQEEKLAFFADLDKATGGFE
ncbi:MAG: hypothetical protein JRI58_14350 [Deltaproteobacteria bacterium]|nr:hypothetical protein [Deltaproteobacteria bacterium]